MNKEEFKTKIAILEQKAVKAERLSRIFHILAIFSFLLVISFGVSAFIFSQHFGGLMIVSMICSVALLLYLSAHFNFAETAGNIRIKQVHEAKKKVDDLVGEVMEKTDRGSRPTDISGSNKKPTIGGLIDERI